EASWLSGYYLIVLTADAGYQWQVPLIVEDNRIADVVAMAATTTWQAYNNYGGESLYEDAAGLFPSGGAREVSYDRPFSAGFGAGRMLREIHLARLLESRGFDVSYTTPESIDRRQKGGPGDLSRARVLWALGHSEYWPHAVREAFDAARDRGASLLFSAA